jgi:hypothetical protein
MTRPPLPTASEVVFDEFGGGNDLAVGASNGWVKPPHVRRNVWISRMQAQQQI